MLLLKDARLLQFLPPEVKEGMEVLIDGNKIVRVGRNLAPDSAPVRTIDLAGNLISPGIVCSPISIRRWPGIWPTSNLPRTSCPSCEISGGVWTGPSTRNPVLQRPHQGD
jgi:predicted amidohydrolase